MRKMQDVILREVSEEVERFELELVVNYAATNTGRAYVLDGIQTVLFLAFNFQLDYCSIVIYNEKEEELKNFYFKYVNTDKIKEFLKFIEHYCMEYDMEKQGEEEVV